MDDLSFAQFEAASRARGFDEDLEVGLCMRLTDEFIEPLRTQSAIRALSGHAVGGDDAVIWAFCRFSHGLFLARFGFPDCSGQPAHCACG